MIRILVGDARDRPRELPTGSVQCCVTSPPYYGLRDYGTAQWEGGDPTCSHSIDKSNGISSSSLQGGKKTTNHQQEAAYRDICRKCGARRIDNQIGLEATPDEYVARLVEVFREVKRVLRDDGTLWLNLGDSYTSGGRDSFGPPSGNKNVAVKSTPRPPQPDCLKPKDLIGIPWLVAFALRTDGWWLRSAITWCKTAAMPESVRDRPTSATEQIFLLAKSQRYYYDQDAIREPGLEWTGQAGTFKRSNGKAMLLKVPGQQHASHREERDDRVAAGRNSRNFWLLGPEPYPDAHFATFPTEIPRRAIAAGTSERGACPKCGAPWRRVVDVEYTNPGNRTTNGPRSLANRSFSPGFPVRLEKISTTTGWQPGCTCDAGDPVPCVVLDPFAGAGTTLMVADRLGRDAIGIELNPEYCRLAEKRIRDDVGMFVQVVVE